MAFEDYKQKEHLVIVYTGEGKGKTSASLGLMIRALGRGWSVAYIQFIKHWTVGEHDFIHKIQDVYGKDLHFFKGGKGFYNAGELSDKSISEAEHKEAAQETYDEAIRCLKSGDYQLVLCDEINNAVNDGLLNRKQLEEIIATARKENVSLCLTGRNFPKELIDKADIATNMTKLKHHFDDKYLANEGLDY